MTTVVQRCVLSFTEGSAVYGRLNGSTMIGALIHLNCSCTILHRHLLYIRSGTVSKQGLYGWNMGRNKMPSRCVYICIYNIDNVIYNIYSNIYSNICQGSDTGLHVITLMIEHNH